MMRRTILALSLLLSTSVFAGTGRVVIINSDAPGVGFNDPTPVEPIGGNPGITRGEQRLNVVVRAADLWSSLLDTDVDVRVRMSFGNLACDENGAVLAGTFVGSWHANFANAPYSEVWYPAALANKFAGADLNAAQADMTIQFNSAIDAGCIENRAWYYGYEPQTGNDESMYHVTLHEVAHGLGMSSRGTDFLANRPSIYDLFTFDRTIGLHWNQMTQQQRVVSLTNTGNLVWSGPHVTRMAPGYIEPATIFAVSQPSAVARPYAYGTAQFGPSVKSAAMSGRIVPALDEENAEGPTASDGCTAFTNAASIDGNIALIDRGGCVFVEKAKNAQAAGAVGVIVTDNRDACAPPGMAGTAPEVLIPVISITQSDGNDLRAQTEEIRGSLRLDPSRLAGASDEGNVRLYAPCSEEPGSSKHHWDVTTSPNLLMEPAINPDLAYGVDLSLYQLQDIGWTLNRTGRRLLRRR